MKYQGTETDSSYPKGCYLHSSTSVYFNLHKTGRRQGNSRPMCVAPAALPALLTLSTTSGLCRAAAGEHGGTSARWARLQLCAVSNAASDPVPAC